MTIWRRRREGWLRKGSNQGLFIVTKHKPKGKTTIVNGSTLEVFKVLTYCLSGLYGHIV